MRLATSSQSITFAQYARYFLAAAGTIGGTVLLGAVSRFGELISSSEDNSSKSNSNDLALQKIDSNYLNPVPTMTHTSFEVLDYSPEELPIFSDPVIIPGSTSGSGPVVAKLEGGGHVEAWTNGTAIVGQRYNSTIRIGNLFVIASNPTVPISITSFKDGTSQNLFVVTWPTFSSDPNQQWNIFARLYAYSGTTPTPLTSVFQVNTVSAGSQDSPVAMGFPGGFGVFFNGYNTGGTDGDQYGAFFNAKLVSGGTVTNAGTQTQLNVITTGNQWQPVGTFYNGNMVAAVWSSLDTQGHEAIYVRLFQLSSSGLTPITSSETLISPTTQNQRLPAISAGTNALFTTYDQFDSSVNDWRATGSLLNTTSGSTVASTPLSSIPTGRQTQTKVVSVNGGFMSTWQEQPQAGSSSMKGKFFSENLNSVGPNFNFSSSTSQQAATLTNGKVVLTNVASNNVVIRQIDPPSILSNPNSNSGSGSGSGSGSATGASGNSNSAGSTSMSPSSSGSAGTNSNSGSASLSPSSSGSADPNSNSGSASMSASSSGSAGTSSSSPSASMSPSSSGSADPNSNSPSASMSPSSSGSADTSSSSPSASMSPSSSGSADLNSNSLSASMSPSSSGSTDPSSNSLSATMSPSSSGSADPNSNSLSATMSLSSSGSADPNSNSPSASGSATGTGLPVSAISESSSNTTTQTSVPTVLIGTAAIGGGVYLRNKYIEKGWNKQENSLPNYLRRKFKLKLGSTRSKFGFSFITEITALYNELQARTDLKIDKPILTKYLIESKNPSIKLDSVIGAPDSLTPDNIRGIQIYLEAFTAGIAKILGFSPNQTSRWSRNSYQPSLITSNMQVAIQEMLRHAETLQKTIGVNSAPGDSSSSHLLEEDLLVSDASQQHSDPAALKKMIQGGQLIEMSAASSPKRKDSLNLDQIAAAYTDDLPAIQRPRAKSHGQLETHLDTPNFEDGDRDEKIALIDDPSNFLSLVKSKSLREAVLGTNETTPGPIEAVQSASGEKHTPQETPHTIVIAATDLGSTDIEETTESADSGTGAGVTHSKLSQAAETDSDRDAADREAQALQQQEAERQEQERQKLEETADQILDNFNAREAEGANAGGAGAENPQAAAQPPAHQLEPGRSPSAHVRLSLMSNGNAPRQGEISREPSVLLEQSVLDGDADLEVSVLLN